MRLRSYFEELRRAAGLAGCFLCLTAPANLVLAHPELPAQIEQLDGQLTAAPGEVDLLLRRGDLKRRAGDFEGARADFAAAQVLAPGSPDLDYYQGQLALATHDPVTAEQQFGHYLEHRPDDAAAWALHGEAWLELGQPVEAAADFGQAIARSERPAPALFIRQAQALRTAGPEHTAEALWVVDRGLARFPAEISLLGLGTDLALDSGQPGLARRYLEQVPEPIRALPQWQARAEAVGD